MITVLDEPPNSIRVRMRCSHCGDESIREVRSGEDERVFRLRHRACGEAKA